LRLARNACCGSAAGCCSTAFVVSIACPLLRVTQLGLIRTGAFLDQALREAAGELGVSLLRQ